MAIPLSPDSVTHQAQKHTLTHPNIGVNNNGYDNENNDLILWTGFILYAAETETRYIVSEMLGQGTFGQVAKCICQQTGEVVAVKVIKNQTAFFHQAQVEKGVLRHLNEVADPEDQHHIVQMHDQFVFKEHLCLVFELLSLNLYELIKQNQFRGLSMRLLRIFLSQILDALCVLRGSQIIHCDLKPENVLLKGQTGEIKVIDFGSACFENHTMYSYIQSRFYRSPEVLLGHAYDMAIDMWSVGCMAAELFLGLPLFPGASEHDLLVRIVDMLGMPPDHVLRKAQHTNRYFKQESAVPASQLQKGSSSRYRSRYLMRTQAEFEAMFNCKAPAGKRYFQHTKLADIVGAYPMTQGLDDQAALEERQQRGSFLDFLLGILDLDPACRWSPKQALQHPFITRALFTGPFQPTPDSPVPIRTDYAASTTADSHAALMLSAQGQSAAALAHSSPEARAQAHLAALAAIANLGPHSAFTPSSLPAAYQAAMQQQIDAAMQPPAPSSMQMAASRLLSQTQQQQQQQQQLQPQPLSGLGASLLSSQGTPFGQRAAASRHMAGSDSTASSIGGNFTPSMSIHQSPYSSYPLHQQQQMMSRFDSIVQSPVALPMPIQGQMSSHMPFGSLEALRGGWHAPRGRNAFGDMYASSLTVHSQRLSGAGSLGGSLVGSLGGPRLPPSLSNRSRNSFPASPVTSAVLSPSSVTPAAAATPNRVFGFGSASYSDQQSASHLQQQLSRQQSLQQRPYPSPHHRKQRQQASQQQQQQQAEQDSFGRLFDDLAGLGTADPVVQPVSRQPSLDAPHPGDWDPYFSEEQLLAEDISTASADHRQAQASQPHSAASHVFTPYQSASSQLDVSMLPNSATAQQLPGQSQEQLAQQLPASFASMSTSFYSMDSPGQTQSALQGQSQADLTPHDPAWFREGQLATAVAQQQQQALAWQQAVSHGMAVQIQQQQQQPLSQDTQMLLAAQQQSSVSNPDQGAQQQWQQAAWDQQQQQLLLAAAAAAAGLQQQQGHNGCGSLFSLLPHSYAMTSSGVRSHEAQIQRDAGLAGGVNQSLLPATDAANNNWLC